MSCRQISFKDLVSQHRVELSMESCIVCKTKF